jgi:hypothetical protein
MVWYVPPLSPITARPRPARWASTAACRTCARCASRCKYLANLLTAGDEEPVARGLERMLAMRTYMRAKTVDGVIDETIAASVGLTGADRGDVPADGDRQLRGPLRHPDDAPRGAEDAYDLRGGCGFSSATAARRATPGSTCSAGSSARTTPARWERRHEDPEGAVGAAELPDGRPRRRLRRTSRGPRAGSGAAGGRAGGGRATARRPRRRRPDGRAGALHPALRPHPLAVAASLRACPWREPGPRPGDGRPHQALRGRRLHADHPRAAGLPAALPGVRGDPAAGRGDRADRPARPMSWRRWRSG